MMEKQTRSKMLQEAIDIIPRLDPECLASVVRMLKRHRDGMPMGEAVRLGWDEAKAEGLVPADAVLPVAADMAV